MVVTSSDVRRHGLSWPLSLHQVLSWVGIVYTVALYLVAVDWTIVDLVIFCCIFAVGLAAFFITSLVDPGRPPDPGNDPVRFCHVCNLHMSEATKHCRICNKCIPSFDHHCLYLNTCIGGRNYRPFFLLVTMCTALLSMYLVQVGVILITGSNDARVTDFVHRSIFGTMQTYFLCLGMLSLVPLGLFFMVASLLCFHIYIGVLGISTYAWIVGQRDAPPVLELAQPSPKRMEEIEARRQEVYAQWLKQSEHRTKSRSGPSHSAVSSSAQGAVPGPALAYPPLRYAPSDDHPAVPRSRSESLIEDVLGVELEVTEGDPVPYAAREANA